MSNDEFESIVIEALDSLPPEFAHHLDNVEVQTVRVTTAPQALTVTAPARAPVTGNPY